MRPAISRVCLSSLRSSSDSFKRSPTFTGSSATTNSCSDESRSRSRTPRTRTRESARFPSRTSSIQAESTAERLDAVSDAKIAASDGALVAPTRSARICARIKVHPFPWSGWSAGQVAGWGANVFRPCNSRPVPQAAIG